MIRIAFILAIASLGYFHQTEVAGAEWTKSTFELHEKITKMGVEPKLGKHIITKCKISARNPRDCVKVAVSIYGNESGFGKKCRANSCWGFVGHKFKSKTEAFDRWLKSFNAHWWKHDG